MILQLIVNSPVKIKVFGRVPTGSKYSVQQRAFQLVIGRLLLE
jgi:hypothetical protein